MSRNPNLRGDEWTAEEIETVIRDYHNHVRQRLTAEKLRRSMPSLGKQLGRLRAAGLLDRCCGEAKPPAVLTNDPAHVRAVLLAGGFGRLPLAWNEPKPFVWRAA